MRTQTKYLKDTDSLHEILELGFDVEASFEELKSNTRNGHLIDWLTKKQELTTDFIMQILTFFYKHEIQLKSHETLKGKLCKMCLDTKLRFLEINDDLILRESKKMDDLMLNTLVKQIELADITKEAQQIYINYKTKLSLLLKPQKEQESLIC